MAIHSVQGTPLSAQPVVLVHRGTAWQTAFAQSSRYEAVMQEGDVVWTFGCCHLHHEERAARKCFSALRKRWAAWTGRERIIIPSPHLPADVVLVEMVRATPGGGSTSIRMTGRAPSENVRP